MFVGTFGFVVFAFDELDRSLRPVAEGAIPFICFVSAWFLRRQRAPHVAAGLELLGGLTLPLVTYASFVDDGDIPSDLTGDALVIALALGSLVIGLAYATWSRRRPESTLRFLVAPMAWMVVWALGLWFADQPVAGIAIRRPNPWQMTLFTLAVVGSLALARGLPDRRFAPATRFSALAGLALGYSLTLASGFAEGWPPGPVAITGAVTIVGIDLLAAGARPAAGARLAQSLVVAFTVAALVPELDVGWAGAAAVLVALALLERWSRRRVGNLELATAVAQLAVGLAMATQEPWATVAAFGAASLWAHVRRVTGVMALGVHLRAQAARWTWMDALAALLPVGLVYGLWVAAGAKSALLVSAFVLLGAAAAYRAAGTDRFADLWLSASAVVVGLLTSVPWVGDGPSQILLVTSIVIAGVLLAATPAGPARVWLGAAGLAWAGFLGMDVAGLAAEARAQLFAAGGFAVTLAAASFGRTRSTMLHLETVGQLASGAALASVAVVPGGSRLVCLGAWTLGWIVIATAGEIGERSDTRVGAPLAGVAPGLALLSLPLLLVDAARFAGLLEGRPELAGMLLAALALVEAATSRAVAARRPLGPLVAWGSFALGALAIGVAAPDRWFLVVSCAVLIGVVALIPVTLRAAGMVWAACVSSAALTVLLAERAGVPTNRLYAPGFGWSSVALVGSIALDERLARRRPSGALVRARWLDPSLALGTVGLAISLGLTLAEPASVHGAWMLGGSAVFLVAALQLRAGWVSGIAWSLASFGAASLAREFVLDDPWILVAGAAVPAGTAWILTRFRKDERSPWLRWDLPPFVVAHLVAGAGLAHAVVIDEVAPAWLAAGALSLSAAMVLARWPWVISGAVLGGVGAADLGPGWLAAALGAYSLGTGVAASRSQGNHRLGLQAVSACLAALAWVQGAEAVGWPAETVLQTTAIVSGVVLLAAASAVRLKVLTSDWMLPAAALAAIGVLAVESSASIPGGALADVKSAHLALAAALAMATVATATSAAPTGLARLRESSALVAALAAGEALIGVEASGGFAVSVLVAGSLVSVALALALWRTGIWRPWAPVVGIFGALTAYASLPVAAAARSDRSALVAALLACGVETAGAGLVLRRAGLLTAAPLFFSGAWIAFASEAFAGDPQWFTTPIGLAALAVVEVLRWDHRRRGVPAHRPELVALEVAAIAFLIGASPIRVVQGSSLAGVVGAILGSLVAAWGALTHVRRRLFVGVAAAAGCLLLIVLVPLAKNIPDVEGVTLWLLLGAVGVAVVVIATALERARAPLGAVLRHVGELMDGWE
ncbi:MAG: hypothetical protein ACRDH0_13615 [Actinomycetota bacterium]